MGSYQPGDHALALQLPQGQILDPRRAEMIKDLLRDAGWIGQVNIKESIRRQYPHGKPFKRNSRGQLEEDDPIRPENEVRDDIQVIEKDGVIIVNATKPDISPRMSEHQGAKAEMTKIIQHGLFAPITITPTEHERPQTLQSDARTNLEETVKIFDRAAETAMETLYNAARDSIYYNPARAMNPEAEINTLRTQYPVMNIEQTTKIVTLAIADERTWLNEALNDTSRTDAERISLWKRYDQINGLQSDDVSQHRDNSRQSPPRITSEAHISLVSKVVEGPEGVRGIYIYI